MAGILDVFEFIDDTTYETYRYVMDQISPKKNPTVKHAVGTPPKEFKRTIQQDKYSCGAHATYMILHHFDVETTYEKTKKRLGTNPDWGTSVVSMVSLFRKHRLRVGYYPFMRYRKLISALNLGAIVLVHLDGGHFGVVHGMSSTSVYLADPSYRKMGSRRTLSVREFQGRWTNWALTVRA